MHYDILLGSVLINCLSLNETHITQWEIVLMRVAEMSLSMIKLDVCYVILIRDILRSQKYYFEDCSIRVQENICILPFCQVSAY